MQHQTAPTQLPVADMQLVNSVGVLAEHIARARFGATATFGTLTPTQREECVEDAALALLHRDSGWHLPALYVAMNDQERDETEGGITVFSPVFRVHTAAEFDAFFRAYRKVLAGDRPAERRQLGLLALADLSKAAETVPADGVIHEDVARLRCVNAREEV